MFMQLSFHETARRTHTLLYEALDFDLMITSDRFESLKNTGQFPAGRLNQARTVDGVADTAPLNIQGESGRIRPQGSPVHVCSSGSI